MAIVELVMPRMGESIIEATIIGWLKKEGDNVDAEETVLEVATDKVDSEIPSPVTGTIKKILHHKDEVVSVDKVLALIETEDAIDVDQVPKPPEEQVEPPQPIEEIETRESAEIPTTQEASKSAEPLSTKKAIALSRKSLSDKIPNTIGGRFFSPLVRNIARAEGISRQELEALEGTGAEGRVTKYDLLNYVDSKKASPIDVGSGVQQESRTFVSQHPTQEKQPANVESKTRHEQPTGDNVSTSASIGTSGDEIIELSRMRRVIAGHMLNSLSTSAHVTSFVEADATKLVNWRNRVKEEYLSKYGEKLTFSPLFTEAVIQALRDFPAINASVVGDKLIVKKSLNIGIATAMENGNLIVPVIKNAGHLNLHGLTQKLNDITSRARKNKLTPDEIQGGTFTISNIGTFGNVMGTPIINQPELAVLALGAIKKKPVIQETPDGDIIAIRHMMFLSLSFDHRVIDGYQGGMFLNRIGQYIENFDSNRPI